MTVGELIEQLNKFDKDLPIVCELFDVHPCSVGTPLKCIGEIDEAFEAKTLSNGKECVLLQGVME